MLGMSKFGDAQLERLYRQHKLAQNVSLLVYVLCVFTASLLMLAVNHLPKPGNSAISTRHQPLDIVLLLATISAALALALNILLNVRTLTKQSGLLTMIGIWLCFTVICMMPSGGQHALLPTIIACFTLYTLFPYDIVWTMLSALGLSFIQIAVFILLPTHPFTIDQLLATILIHAWSNFIGIYLYATKNRLSRAAFLNSRNVLLSQHEALKNQAELESLLMAACPPHSLQMALNYLCRNKPTMTSVHVEKYDEVTVLYATFNGLEAILAQITAQDAVRLLNEFNSRVDQLTRKNNFVRIPSDAIVLVSGIAPDSSDCQAQLICQAAWDLLTVIRSFCDASTADLEIKIGIATGQATTGIIGQNKWHYELAGKAFEEARQLSSIASMGTILISGRTQDLVNGDFLTERLELNRSPYCRLLQSKIAKPSIPNTMLFPSQRRMSLTTVPQAINRLLQTSFTTNNETIMLFANGAGRRKRKLTDSISEKLELDEVESSQLINFVSMTFNESAIEQGYQFEVDRWFIPALATTIFFLVIYGTYEMLVLPRMILTLGLVIFSLGVMFLILLMLYVSYFESFCRFITRTSAGHSLTILFIIVLIFVCGTVNTFFCPPYSAGSTCHLVYYPIMSCTLWMLTTPVFVRFSSFYLLLTLTAGISVFALHIFLTHADLYFNFALLTGWRIEFDIVIGLATLGILIFVQCRRNERLIRKDYLSHIKFVENMKRFDRVNEFVALVLSSQLPEQIALNYLNRNEPYCHSFHSVGVITVRFGNQDDWLDDAALTRLQELLKEVDQLAMTHVGLEKVRSSHSTFTAAVGVLPEVTKNVHDVPFTIGDLLASLTNFGIALKDIAADEGLEICIGIDVGSALSVVVGGNKPQYDVIGAPRLRSIELMKAAARNSKKLIISEEVYLALRPRHFDFDDKNPIQVTPALIGYGFRQSVIPNKSSGLQYPPPAAPRSSTINKKYQQDFAPHKEVGSSAESSDADDIGPQVCLIDETTQSTTLPTLGTNSPVFSKPADLHSLSFFTQQNQKTDENLIEDNFSPKNSTFNLMNSSISSELYSIDLSVETDSEIEWVTPEMLVYDRMRTNNCQNGQPVNGTASLMENQRATYKGDHAKQYSDFSEAENIRGTNKSSKFRRKRHRQPLSRNGPKIPGWLSSRTSFNSELSLPQESSLTALDKLNITAKRVDRMLQELSNLHPTSEITKIIDCAPFPLGFNGMSSSTKSVNSNRRELSSACHTEYDNADSEAALSDSEMVSNSRLENLKCSLKLGSKKNSSALALNNRRHKQSRLSDLAYQLSGFGRKKRLFDTGNEADVDSNCSSLASSAMFDKLRWKSVHSIGYDNEYEFASEFDDNAGGSCQSDLSNNALPPPETFQGAVGNNINLRAMDADDNSDENGNTEFEHNVRQQVQQLSRDICKNFGDYKLSSFSDADI